jgi:glycosyltransferase involved in cell wall biosynthesis
MFKINNNISVAHLSLNLEGGGGVAIKRLHSYLIKQKIKSKIFTYSSSKNDDQIQLFSKSIFNYLYFKLIKKINFLFLYKKNYYSFYYFWKFRINNIEEIMKLEKFKPTILIIYNNNSFINYELIEKLQNKLRFKIIIYPLDMEPLTGGCHYFWSCENYKNNCVNCPAVSKSLSSYVKKNLEKKKEFYKKVKPTFISGTKNLDNFIKKASATKSSTSLSIYTGVDKSIFKNKKIISNKIYILYRSSYNLRKGENYLIKTLSKLKNNDSFKSKIVFNLIGKSSLHMFLKENKFLFKNYNHVKNDMELSKVYQCSDFYLNTSIQDGGPMMINEALASGVPVITFPTQLAKEIIIDKQNGYLINKNFSEELYLKFIWLAKNNRSQINILKKKTYNFSKIKFDIKDNIKTIVTI